MWARHMQMRSMCVCMIYICIDMRSVAVSYQHVYLCIRSCIRTSICMRTAPAVRRCPACDALGWKAGP